LPALGGTSDEGRRKLRDHQAAAGGAGGDPRREGARRRLPGISFATVYNSLRYLKQEGLIGEVRFGTDATRYDRTVSRHDHAICNACGKLIDIELRMPASLAREAAELSRFEPESIEVILRGVCPDCTRG
jgi:Fur family transcriptional regulator, peroxide stress response regulator